MANDNRLYCMANGIFYLDSSNALHTPPYYCGGNDWGGMIQANDGLIYGYSGYGCGIWGIDPATDNCITYNQTYPAIPIGTPFQASNNKIYGITINGGAYNYGRIFYYDNISNNITYIHDFDSINGGFTYTNNHPDNDWTFPKGNLMELRADAGINQLSKPNPTIVNISPNPFSYSTEINIKSDIYIRSGSIEIYDITGREVSSLQGINGTNSQLTLFRNQLESGMYFYKLVQNNSEILANGKLIIE